MEFLGCLGRKKMERSRKKVALSLSLLVWLDKKLKENKVYCKNISVVEKNYKQFVSHFVNENGK